MEPEKWPHGKSIMYLIVQRKQIPKVVLFFNILVILSGVGLGHA